MVNHRHPTKRKIVSNSQFNYLTRTNYLIKKRIAYKFLFVCWNLNCLHN